MAEIDVSVFSKVAELLARPLSPTALEKEAAKSGKPPRAKAKVFARSEARKAAPKPVRQEDEGALEQEIRSAVSELRLAGGFKIAI